MPPSPSRPVETRAVDVDAEDAEDAVEAEEAYQAEAASATQEGVYETRPGSCPSSSDDADFHPR